MNIQPIIASGLQDVVTALVGVLVAFLVAFIKHNFTAKQIATAGGIAADAVDFATQAAKKFGWTKDLDKFNGALGKAKDLAAKAGIRLTDSQWETLLESAYKTAKAELQPLQIAQGPALTEDDILNLIKGEVAKVLPNVPADAIINTVKPLVQQELSKLTVSVNVMPNDANDVAPVIPDSASKEVSTSPEAAPEPVTDASTETTTTPQEV